MRINMKYFLERAKEYLELEANTKVLKIEFAARFKLFGNEDLVLSAKTSDKNEPLWWLVGGSTPINLYSQSKFATPDEAFSMHTGLMLRIQDKQFRKDTHPPKGVGYDAFICHASEDKVKIARPLSEKLKEMGFWIWYDEFSLEIGDSLRRSIDKGLINSRYGIIILSPAFFKKEWPQYELNGLTAREIESKKVILPIWHKIEKKDILSFSPPLADKVAANTKNSSIEEVAHQLAKVLIKD